MDVCMYMIIKDGRVMRRHQYHLQHRWETPESATSQVEFVPEPEELPITSSTITSVSRSEGDVTRDITHHRKIVLPRCFVVHNGKGRHQIG